MTSPLICEEGLSMIEGEKLSPIKLPANDVSRNTRSPSPPPPLSVIAKHPHGLTAKRQARRNTINHSTQKGSINTPLRKGTEVVASVKRRFPFTSPLMRDASPNLKKSKNEVAGKPLKPQVHVSSPSNKENELALVKMEGGTNEENWSRIPNNFGSSPSMIVRTSSFNSNEESKSILGLSFTRREKMNVKSDDSCKIAKVITNANDSLPHSQENDNDYSVQVDDVFNREDLVVKISSGISPVKADVKSTASQDNENENYNDDGNTCAEQEENTAPEENQSETGQLNKNSGDDGDGYRFHKSNARSPRAHRNTSITETVSEDQTLDKPSSPLRGHVMLGAAEKESHEMKSHTEGEDSSSEESELEEEPTMNFLSSPNSKPIFSLTHVQSMQDEHYRELESLDELLSQKNQEILKLSEELSATNNNFLIFDQKINDLKLSKMKLQNNEHLLKTQLDHIRRQQAIANKNLKIKEKKLNRLNLSLESESKKCESINISNEVLNKENKQLREELSSLENERTKYRGDINKFEYQVDQLKEDLSSKDNDIRYLTEANLEFNAKIETLLKEKENLLHDVGHLTQENNGLEEINTKQQELLEELDKLETLAKDKIANLELIVDDKISELKVVGDKKDQLLHDLERASAQSNDLQGQLGKAEDKVKEMTDLFNSNSETQREFNDEISRLQEQLDTSHQSSSALTSKLEGSQMEIESLLRKLEEVNEKQHALATTNAEKDEIISGDTKKMDELVERINNQKQTIADYENRLQRTSEESPAEGQTSQSLMQEIDDLKSQVEQGHTKTNARIQEVAEQLYFEYSKKHEMKVDQVRASFKKQIDKLNFEKKAQARDIESLHKKLDTVDIEKEQLLQLIDDYRAVSDPTFKKKLSPKKSGFKKPKV